jgi:3-dehydroquinate synthase
MTKTRLLYSAQRWHQLSNLIGKKKYSSVILLYDNGLPVRSQRMLKKRLAPDLLIPFHAKEKNKTWRSVNRIINAMLIAEVDRQAVLINAGGGTLCDTGAFVASVYKRGMDYINIPTTLLAQSDAAIGGKTSINHAGIKNVIGTFHFPQAVLIDPAFLDSLPQRQIRAGMAEIIKMAIVADKQLFVLLSKADGLPSDAGRLIVRAARCKAAIVKRDPFDRSVRQILNFGHTIGHAIESLLSGQHDGLLHGEAIAWGMLAESFIAWQKKLISLDELNHITDIITAHFTLRRVDENHFETLLNLMRQDKKRRNGVIRFSLPDGIGKALTGQNATDSMIINAMKYANFVIR